MNTEELDNQSLRAELVQLRKDHLSLAEHILALATIETPESLIRAAERARQQIIDTTQ